MPVTQTCPLEVAAHGLPSLKLKLDQFKLLHAPPAPVSVKRRMSSVPEPLSGVVPKAEMVIWPLTPVLGVIVRPLLSVPAVSKAGLAGLSTAALNGSTKS